MDPKILAFFLAANMQVQNQQQISQIVFVCLPWPYLLSELQNSRGMIVFTIKWLKSISMEQVCYVSWISSYLLDNMGESDCTG